MSIVQKIRILNLTKILCFQKFLLLNLHTKMRYFSDVNTFMLKLFIFCFDFFGNLDIQNIIKY